MTTRQGNEQKIDLHGQKIKARIYIEHPSEKPGTVAGFPFSLIEMLLTGMFKALERLVARLVLTLERRVLRHKRR